MSVPKLGAIRIDGEEYLLDDLSLDDLEELEELLGAPMGEVAWQSAKALKAAAYIVLRNHKEGFTIEDAGRIKVAAMIQPKADEEEPPKRPEGPPTLPSGSPGVELGSGGSDASEAS